VADPVLVEPPEPEPSPIVDPEPITQHKFPDREPSFSTYMGGCRCPACHAAHRAVSAKAGQGRKKKKPAGRAAAREVDASAAHVIGQSTSKLPGTAPAAGSSAWEGIVGNLLVLVLVRLALFLKDGNAEAAAPLTPTDEEVDILVKPIARVIAGTSLNRRYGRTIVENGDVLDALLLAGEMVPRYVDAWKEKTATNPPRPGATFNGQVSEPTTANNGAAVPGGFIPGQQFNPL